MTEIDELKSRVNIVDIVGEKVRLKKAGINYFGLCPFHGEKTPSFSVNEQLQIYKCFGCGESGDIIKFIEKTENITFREVLEELSERTGYKLKSSNIDPKTSKFEEQKRKILELNSIVANFYKKKLLENENEGLQYAKKRGISKSTVDKFLVGYASQSSQNLFNYLKQLGYEDNFLLDAGVVVRKEKTRLLEDKFKNRLIFSVLDQKGNIVAFSGRYIGKSQLGFEPPRYLNSPETLVFNKSKTIFGLFQAQESIKKFKFVIVSEGQMNIISSNQIGVENIIASLGTSFTKDHLEILRRFTSNIYLAFDKDNAGKKALLRTLEMIFTSDAEINCKVIYWDHDLGKDPDEVITKDKKFWIDAINSPMDPIDYLMNEFDNKFNLPSLETKNSFLKTIFPIINCHKNLFKKEEYLKKIAETFGITPDQLKQTYLGRSTIKYQRSIPISPKKVVIRKDAVDSFFALIIQNWSTNCDMILGLDRDFVADDYLEIFDCLSLYIDSSDLSEIRENLEGQHQKLFDELAMKNIKADKNLSVEEHLLKSVPNIIRAKYNEVIQKFREDPDNIQLIQLKNKLAGSLLEYSRK